MAVIMIVAATVVLTEVVLTLRVKQLESALRSPWNGFVGMDYKYSISIGSGKRFGYYEPVSLILESTTEELPEELRLVAKLPSITMLSIRSESGDEEILPFVSSFCHVEVMFLTTPNLSKETLSKILESNHLKTLILDRSQLDELEIQNLIRKFPHISIEVASASSPS